MKIKILFFIIFIHLTSCSNKNFNSKVAKPNIIIINLDDLGYGDLSCYGATEIQTPNIDALAKGGIKFTNGYATSATCTPSRYALLTGCYPWRKKMPKFWQETPLY